MTQAVDHENTWGKQVDASLFQKTTGSKALKLRDGHHARRDATSRQIERLDITGTATWSPSCTDALNFRRIGRF